MVSQQQTVILSKDVKIRISWKYTVFVFVMICLLRCREPWKINADGSQHHMTYGSCNFENFQNITRAHKSPNALAFIRFPIQRAKHCANCRTSEERKATLAKNRYDFVIGYGQNR